MRHEKFMKDVRKNAAKAVKAQGSSTVVHEYSIGFAVVKDSEAEEVTADDLISALRERLDDASRAGDDILHMVDLLETTSY